MMDRPYYRAGHRVLKARMLRRITIGQVIDGRLVVGYRTLKTSVGANLDPTARGPHD